MHHLTERPMRILFAGVATIWMILILMSTGFVSALFPESIMAIAPRFYVWASGAIDPVASLMLICILIMTMIRAQGDSPSDSTLVDHLDHPATGVAAHAVDTARHRSQGGNTTSVKPKGENFNGDESAPHNCSSSDRRRNPSGQSD